MDVQTSCSAQLLVLLNIRTKQANGKDQNMIKKIIGLFIVIAIVATVAYQMGWLSWKGERIYEKTKEAVVEKGEKAIEKGKDAID